MAKKKHTSPWTPQQYDRLISLLCQIYWEAVKNDIRNYRHFLLDGWDDTHTDYVKGLDLGARFPDIHPLMAELHEQTHAFLMQRVEKTEGNKTTFWTDPEADPSLQEEIFRKWLLPLRRRVAANQEWSLINRMVEYCEAAETASAMYGHPQSLPGNMLRSGWVTAAVSGITLALGGPTRFLYGTGGNKPAFKPLSKPISSALDLVKVTRNWNMSQHLQSLDEDDARVIPDPFTECSPSFRDRDWPAIGSLEEAGEILRDAYYHAHYTIHPNGTTVELRGHPAIRQVFLKAKRSPKDRYSQDIFARFSLDDGDVCLVWDSQLIDSPSLLVTEAISRPPKHAYLYLVLVQTYHDLITCRYAGDDSSITGETGGYQVPVRKDSKTVLRTLPRIVRARDGDREPRIPMPSPRTGKPHFVSGHPRKVPMSTEHRKAIEKFEQSSGLRILAHLNPEKETWVSPHISPSDGAYDEIPLFIRYQMERDLTRRLEEMRKLGNQKSLLPEDNQ